MWALYSLVCRLRTLYALVYGVATFAQGGWSALPPTQLPVLALVLCLLLRVLIPSAPSIRRGPVALAEHLLDGVSAAAVVGLKAADVAGFCASCVKLLVLVWLW